jgi:hypothetical protein
MVLLFQFNFLNLVSAELQLSRNGFEKWTPINFIKDWVLNEGPDEHLRGLSWEEQLL